MHATIHIVEIGDNNIGKSNRILSLEPRKEISFQSNNAINICSNYKQDTNNDTIHEPLLGSQASHDSREGRSPEPSVSLKDKLRANLAFKRIQYSSVLRKNFILKTRGAGGAGSYQGLLIEVLLPVAFFVLMCLPKALVKPATTDTQLSQAFPLTSGLWSNCYVCERFDKADELLAGGCTLEPHVRIDIRVNIEYLPKWKPRLSVSGPYLLHHQKVHVLDYTCR